MGQNLQKIIPTCCHRNKGEVEYKIYVNTTDESTFRTPPSYEGYVHLEENVSKILDTLKDLL